MPAVPALDDPARAASPARLDGPVLVTGGAKRVGAAVCRELAAAGATVVVHAHGSVAEAEALADALGGAVVTGDLSDPDAVAGLLDAASEAAGAPVRYVVNNASAFPRQRLAQTTYDDLDAMMRLHAWAPLALARDLARAGDDTAGRAVVNLLDTRVTSHDPDHFPYHVSKQALWNLTRTLARELAPVRINGVAPGPILPPTDGSGDTELQAAVDATVLGRMGRPEEVAHAVRFLLEAQYVTGDVVFVDGGRHLRT